MSDSEDENKEVRSFAEVHDEIKQCKRNPETSGMFVSGWDDPDQDVEEVKDPKANPIDYVLWAAEHGEICILRELLKKQPSLVHAQDADGYTPLHRAAYSNHTDVVSYLLSIGANVHTKTQLGWTALHSASNWNNYVAAARLLAAGADPGALSDGGHTPMHLAAKISHCKSTILILFLRDDTFDIAHKKNNADETPEQLALRNGMYAPLFEMRKRSSRSPNILVDSHYLSRYGHHKRSQKLKALIRRLKKELKYQEACDNCQIVTEHIDKKINEIISGPIKIDGQTFRNHSDHQNEDDGKKYIRKTHRYLQEK